MILMFLIVLLPSASAEDSGSFPAEDEWFSIAIEQHGQTVPVRNNRLALDKAPFTLVVIMKEPLGVLVNFSESSALFKGFLKKRSLDRILPNPDLFMGIAEAPGNEMEVMLIDDVSPHFLYYTDGASHRFSRTEMKQDHIVCRRIISNFTSYDDDFAPYPLEKFTGDIIYLSFLYGEWDEDYNRIELQKEALKVIFKE